MSKWFRVPGKDSLYYTRQLMAQMFLEEGIIEPRRQGVHAMDDLEESYYPLEVNHVRIDVEQVSDTAKSWIDRVGPNMPWAEEHFEERVSGEPMNPAPSHERWPFAQKGNNRHLIDGQFSHTYPERFWPKFANEGNVTPSGRQVFVPHLGIRYLYGDLMDLVEILKVNAWSRQAFLPVWFPEDLQAARERQRVPCTLGYHISLTSKGWDMEYHIRSCDFMRFFQDDIYMAGRLLQWVVNRVDPQNEFGRLGSLHMNISNFHCFQGDIPVLKRMTDEEDDYASYI